MPAHGIINAVVSAAAAHQNLVKESDHEQAVADAIDVDEVFDDLTSPVQIDRRQSIGHDQVEARWGL